MKRSHLVATLLGISAMGVGASSAVANFPGSANANIRTLADKEKKEDKGEKIPLDKLPKAVVDGVKKAMPGARITKANKLLADGKTTYYLDDVKVGKKGWDVTVAEDGTILKKEECHDND